MTRRWLFFAKKSQKKLPRPPFVKHFNLNQFALHAARLKKGTYPDILKIAKFVPSHKGPRQTKLQTYFNIMSIK